MKLTYLLPGKFSHADTGYEALVEVGNRRAKGWIVSKLPLTQATEELRELAKARVSAAETNDRQLTLFVRKDDETITLKPVLEVSPAFDPVQLQLFEWMAQYYGTSLVEVIETAIPKRAEEAPVPCAEKTELLVRSLRENPNFLSQIEKRAPVQATLLKNIIGSLSPIPLSQLRAFSTTATSALKALKSKQLVSIVQLDAEKVALEHRSSTKSNDSGVFSSTCPTNLTPAQERAVKSIGLALEAKDFCPILLYGVTGSGKTEVYIRAIQQVLAQGGSALIVVPEISLTPQFLDQLQSRLQVPLALLHSQLGAKARWQAWKAALTGKTRVAIGARSAVFAPLKNLSLIVIDEEHESSYKQSDSFRYNARDVAVMRAKFANAVAVLGSATPSFESLVNAREQRYRLLELPDRATTRPLPTMEIVDLTKIKRKEMITENISPRLYEELQKTLKNGGQAVILYNRRGFASYLQCETCNEVVSCPNCSVSLTFHKKKNRLLCHYCNLSMLPPAYCNFCRNPETTKIETDPYGLPVEKDSVTKKVGLLRERGAGTEKVVEELATLFPEAKILRMDRDTVQHKDSYREILGTMRTGKADILVGTQMIAKGHDLPGVTLVGIINADVGLHLPDFRASEKAFQLITQAAGRAGRGQEPGIVLLQTSEPQHPTIVAAVTGRFKAFARYELEHRKNLGYPPEGRLLRLIVSSSIQKEAFEGAFMIRDTLASLVQPNVDGNGSSFSILGPAPAPYLKLCGRYRWHLLVKSTSPRTISELASKLNAVRNSIDNFKDFRLAIDVDAVDML